MNLCPVCQRCYDDTETICSVQGHGALVAHRPGSRIIAGKYRLDRLLGRGGVGAVYSGTHIELDSPVAVKLLLPALVDDASALERFRREARAAARLSHPSLAQTYDFGPLPEGGAYIVMELVNGPTLRAVIDERGPLPIATAVVIARRILEGIDVAHRSGIIHRDLKPSNVMLATEHDATERPKIVDFGLAKLAETTPVGSDAVTLAGTLVGTPRYMSPEQCAGRELDPRSDLYSLGVILFEMLTGRVPFEAPTATALALRHINDAPDDVRSLRADIPAGLADLVMRLLEKDPARRPQSAAEVGFELAQLDGGTGATYVAPERTNDAAGPATRVPADEPFPTERTRSRESDAIGDGAPRRPARVPGTDERPRVPSEAARRRTSSLAKPRRSSALPLALIGLVIAGFALWWLLGREPAADIGELREVPADSIAAEPMEPGESPGRSGAIPENSEPPAATPRRTPRASTPPPDRSASNAELRTAITDWIASTNARDVDAHLEAYAPRVERFYLQRGVSRSQVRAVKQKLFDDAAEVRMGVGDARVSYTDGGRTATTRFRKEYEITARDGSVSRGAVLQELVWQRGADGWRIVSERDARILAHQ